MLPLHAILVLCLQVAPLRRCRSSLMAKATPQPGGLVLAILGRHAAGAMKFPGGVGVAGRKGIRVKFDFAPRPSQWWPGNSRWGFMREWMQSDGWQQQAFEDFVVECQGVL